MDQQAVLDPQERHQDKRAESLPSEGHSWHAVDDTQALEVVLEVAASWHLGVQILGSHPAWPLEAVRVEYKRHSGYLLVPEESEIQAARPFAAVLVVVVDMDLEKMLESQKA